MAIESENDLLIFVDADDWGVEATINGTLVTGQFFDNSVEVPSPFSNIEITSNNPGFYARSSDIVASAVDTNTLNACTINGASYNCIDIMPDGTGMTWLDLHEG